MSIENTLASIDSSLQQIVTLLTAQQSASAEAQPSQEKKTRTRKSDTAPSVADEKKPEAPAATEQPTATTAPTATVQAAPASVPTSTTETPPQADTHWQTVLGAIQALNKSDKPGHGRDGVLAVLKQFGLEGKKVPQLEGLGKNAEVLAFVNSLLNAPASDDLGL